MIKFFKIYWAFALNQIKSNFVYKGRFYLFVFRKFLGMFIYYYLWMAIYASTTSGELGGFTRSEMIMYKLFLLLRLLAYFTKIKRGIFPLENEQAMEDKNILQLIRELQDYGE